MPLPAETAPGPVGGTKRRIRATRLLPLRRCQALQPHRYTGDFQGVAVHDAGAAREALASRRSDGQGTGRELRRRLTTG